MLPMWTSHSVLVVLSRPRHMRPHVDPPSAPRSSVLQAHLLHLFPVELFFFHSLCLGDSVFICINPCLSRQGSLDIRSGSFSTFVVVWFCRSSMRCRRCTARTTSSVIVSLDVCRQDVESSQLNLWNSFNYNPWQWVQLLLCQMGLSLSISTQEPPCAMACRTSHPSS